MAYWANELRLQTVASSTRLARLREFFGIMAVAALQP